MNGGKGGGEKGVADRAKAMTMNMHLKRSLQQYKGT
jgi:hypothetical protein